MSVSYKRTIIQIPLKDVKLFQDYANTYGLSVSSAIISLAKKGFEQEQVIRNIPSLIEMYNDIKDNPKIVKKAKKTKNK